MQANFPLSALVGQETLKRALLLAATHPGLGGVLIRGTKGIAKSTAVRALAAILPCIKTRVGCPFQLPPDEEVVGWPLVRDAEVILRPAPLVELPLGATEDRVLGSLHLERALQGERFFEPGLLAAANRGILYIDEVNLLPDHLVDILLDASASGVHRVEREGISLQHPAQLTLIGTMNPEEGDLRPQLLDRFGLVVDLKDLTDASDRAEAIRRRLAFELDPAEFLALWKPLEDAERERLVRARNLLPNVRISQGVIHQISEHCLAAGVEGLRADLSICKAASAWAAYQGKTEVETADVELVAELALVHRRRFDSPPEPPPPPERQPPGSRVTEAPQPAVNPTPAAAASVIFQSAGLFQPRVEPQKHLFARSVVQGRWRISANGSESGAHRAIRLFQAGDQLSLAGTLRAAAPYQKTRGRTCPDGRIILRPMDLRGWTRKKSARCLVVFVVDASGSMGAWKRMRQTKAAILSLYTRAYSLRDRIAIIAFRRASAHVVLPPSRNLQLARRALERLPVGGSTPLAHGLAAACLLIRNERRKQASLPIWTVILTDGRTNVAIGGRDPWQDASCQARALAAYSTDCLVVDTEIGWPRFGRALALAGELKCRCLSLEGLLGRPITEATRRAI